MRRFDFADGQAISGGRIVRVKQMNHIVEVVALQRESNGFENILKLSRTHYVLKDTGEVLEYNLSENRADNIAGLKDTFKKIRDLINNNFVGSSNEIHLTLTYAENMTDPKRLHADFKKFWQRFKRRYGDGFDYLTVVEPQGRGAWHCHVLIRRNDGQKLFVPASELEDMWGCGFVKAKALDGVDNIGAYLSAYLGDIELTDESMDLALDLSKKSHLDVKEVDVGGVKKKFIKGGRLHMYPPGMNLYRHSKGIVFPEVEKMPYQDIKKIVGSATPNYSRTVTIYGDQGEVLNSVTYEQYNQRRK